jgi:hypothetical protein
VPGRSPLLDGFGLVAFASLFPIMCVLAYAQISRVRDPATGNERVDDSARANKKTAAARLPNEE